MADHRRSAAPRINHCSGGIGANGAKILRSACLLLSGSIGVRQQDIGIRMMHAIRNALLHIPKRDDVRAVITRNRVYDWCGNNDNQKSGYEKSF